MAARTNKGFFSNAIAWYGSQPLWFKIGAPVGTFFGMRYLIKRANAARQQQVTGQAYVSALQSSEPQTYPDSEYMIMADKLAAAFSGAGTDEGEVEALFSLLETKTDVMKLIKAFGTRPIGGAIYGSSNLNLPAAIRDEMAQSDIDYYINSALERNGVNFRF